MASKIRRHERIIQLVRDNGFMPIEGLARELDVTPKPYAAISINYVKKTFYAVIMVVQH